MAIITNLRIPWSSALPQDNNFDVSRDQLENPLNQIVSSGDIDWGNENFTSVGTINGFTLSNFLQDITNELFGDLSDVDATVSSGPIEGDILFYDGAIWNRFPRGQDGFFLKSTATSLVWQAISAPVGNFADDAFSIFDNGDATKILNFELSGLTTSTTRTYSWPDKDGVVALLSDVVGGGNTFADDLFRVFDNVDNTKQLAFQIAGITTATTRTATWPDKSGTVAFLSDIQIVSDEFLDGLFRINNTADPTKQLAFDISGVTTATLRTWAIPDSNDTFVGKATTDIFINKSIDGLNNIFANIPFSALADGVDGELITWDSSGVIDTVAVGSSGEVLTSNGVGSAPTFQVAPGAQLQSFVIPASDETTDLTTGDAQVTFRMPYAFTLTKVKASVTSAPTGAVITINIRESGVDVLSTPITIDANELTSESAVTPPVITDPNLADDSEIKIDLDTVGSVTPGKGLKVVLIGNQP